MVGLNIADTGNVARNCKTSGAIQFFCAITCKMCGFTSAMSAKLFVDRKLNTAQKERSSLYTSEFILNK